MRSIFSIVGLIIIATVFAFIFFRSGENQEGKANMNNRIISEHELDLGWYYGGEKDKKSGAPESWKHEDEGSRSARWFDPKRVIFYPSYADMSVGEEVTLHFSQAGKLLDEDFVIIPKSIIAGQDNVTGGKVFAIIFSIRHGDTRDEIRIRSNNEVFTDSHPDTMLTGKNITAELGEVVKWKDFIITIIDVDSEFQDGKEDVNESFVRIKVETAR